MNWFAGRVKKSLPRGASIVQQFDNVELPDWFGITGRKSDVEHHDNSKTSSHAILRVDLGDGTRLDIVDCTWKFRINTGRWDSWSKHEYYEAYIFEVGGVASNKNPLAKVSDGKGKPSKKAMSEGLYEAYQRWARTRGDMEAYP